MNTVNLQGEINRIYHGTRNSIATIYVRGRRTNFPQVVFTGRNREKLESLEQGDFVKVSGLVKTRGERQDDERILHIQFIRGEEIELMDGINEEEKPFMNESELVGEIVRAHTDKDMIALLVRPDNERFNVWAFKYTADAEKEIEDFKEGARISAKCEIQTARKEIRGEVKFFENLVIREAEVMPAGDVGAEAEPEA